MKTRRQRCTEMWITCNTN